MLGKGDKKKTPNMFILLSNQEERKTHRAKPKTGGGNDVFKEKFN